VPDDIPIQAFLCASAVGDDHPVHRRSSQSYHRQFSPPTAVTDTVTGLTARHMATAVAVASHSSRPASDSGGVNGGEPERLVGPTSAEAETG